MKRIDAPTAILTDIHGNTLALEAVLKDASERGIRHYLNLGDIFYGPLDPKGTWDILRSHPMPTILGNQDRILLEAGPDASSHILAVRDAIGEEGLHWLGSLPTTLALGNAFLCHGTPHDDPEKLKCLVTVHPPRVVVLGVELPILVADVNCSTRN